ncbi:MAG TPA: hypothetical protein VFH51_19215 [Myxococcota bacterium]|nr:hypothetical protein [Myxococcota bacterium]
MQTNSNTDFEALRGLRDEIQLKLHLASMEAKDKWAKELEPQFYEVERRVASAGESAKTLVEDLGRSLRKFVDGIKS